MRVDMASLVTTQRTKRKPRLQALQPLRDAEATSEGYPTSGDEDEKLVLRCLRNDRQAWAVLFESCHPRILARLYSLLGRRDNSLEIAHDIAAQVWLSVISDEGRALRHFNAAAGTRLSTYLNGIAVKQGLSYLRKSRRRLRHEAEYFSSSVKRIDAAPVTALDLRDFTQNLTPREAAYFCEELIPLEDGKATSRLSDQNSWQLRHRIRRKLLRFLREEV
jgi:DNA-directed RNA polymerase specialized sigma24 family protein